MSTNYPTGYDSTSDDGFLIVENVKTGKVATQSNSGATGAAALKVDFDPTATGSNYPTGNMLLAIQFDDNSNNPLIVRATARSASGGSPGSFTIGARGLYGTADRNILVGERVGLAVVNEHMNAKTGAILALEGKVGIGASSPATTGHVLQVTNGGTLTTGYNTVANALGYTPSNDGVRFHATTGHKHTGATGEGPIINASGTHSARPTVGQAGRIYIPSDGYYLAREDGSSWLTHFSNGRSYSPPETGWTTYGSPAGTSTIASGYVKLDVGTSSGDNQRWLARPFVTSDWTLDVALRPGFSPNRLCDLGIGVFNSTNGKSLVNRFHHEGSGSTYTGNLQYSIAYYSSWTTLSQNILSPGGANWMMIGGYLWLRLIYTASTGKLDFWIASDGVGWLWPAGPSGQRTLSTDLGGTSSDWKIGMFCNAPSNAQGANVACYSWNGVP